MKIQKTPIKDLFVIKPNIFFDDRGYFFESYNYKEFNKVTKVNFVQDNQSLSQGGVLRGLHFQSPPYDQSKLVSCIKGKVLDVAVDIRKKSKTYGKYFSVILSSTNKKQLFIPKGFAHGFLVLSKKAIFSYKVDNYYSSSHDSGILWNDPKINIDWKLSSDKLIISKKDKRFLNLDQIDNPF